MESHCLRLASLPHTTKLFAAYLEDFSRVKPFYVHPPDEPGVIAAARAVDLPVASRRAVVEVLREQNRAFGADAATERNLDRLAKGAVAIVTGQQVGLFSGPAYSFYKALTAIRWAENLTARGIDAVPVFWLATEDHDLAEVNQCFWMTKTGTEKFAIAPAEKSAGQQVGAIKFGAEISGAVDPAARSLSGPFAAEVERALRESYAAGETFGSAFGKLFARLLSGRGMILLDPLDRSLHRIAAPVFHRAIENAETLRDELLSRGKALDKAGFHSQVKVTAETTLLFMNVDGKREPVRMRGGKFVVGAKSGKTFTSSEILAAIEKTPEIFSPNVLLRAIVQDSLLPTAAYVGGPAEVAYMAQVEVVYRKLGSPMPAILPRAGFTLVEPHVAHLMKKYGLTLEDVFRGRQAVRGLLSAGSLPRGLAKRFDADEKALRRLLKKFEKPLGKLDKTLLGALSTADRKMIYQFSKLRRKVGAAEGFRTGVLERHERILLETLFPQRAPQERALCFLPFLASAGAELLDELAKLAGDSPAQHCVVLT
jgi:bacillithiol synthase